MVVVGGSELKIKGNRHLRFPKGTPLANLPLTLLDKLGVRLKQYGDDSTGELDLLSGV